MIFINNLEYYKKVKLVIWDLDDTFWKGTISEENVTLVQDNIDLVKALNRRGIINSICSKNDYDTVSLFLKDKLLIDEFVFLSINWDPKGKRIKEMINTMSLREENVLFIDDNASNLREVEFYNPNIMIAEPDVITFLLQNVNTVGKDDQYLSRVNQYRLLEKRNIESKKYNSNEDFLINCGITVEILSDCNNEIDRLFELTSRTNQLNFTKNRYSFDEFKRLLQDYSCYYVKCKDKFGDYGVIGFISFDSDILHDFLFSCRTMGMGIEQYVYSYFNFPNIQIVEPVSGSLEKGITPKYINQIKKDHQIEVSNNLEKSVLIKGPCDLEVIVSFISNKENLITEFNFMDKNGIQVDYYNHSINILNCIRLNKQEKDELVHDYSFLSEESFNTVLFDNHYDVVCLSPLMDATLGVYTSVNSNMKVAYGLSATSLTDPTNWILYKEKKIMTARSVFDDSSLDLFKKRFTKIDYGVKDIVNNYKEILDYISPDKVIIILLLSELEFISKDPNYQFNGKEILHKDINCSLVKEFSSRKNVYFINPSDFITKQSDYFDNINHYSKEVYYKLAKEIITIVNNTINTKIKKKSIINMKIQDLMYKLYKKIKKK